MVIAILTATLIIACNNASNNGVSEGEVTPSVAQTLAADCRVVVHDMGESDRTLKGEWQDHLQGIAKALNLEDRANQVIQAYDANIASWKLFGKAGKKMRSPSPSPPAKKIGFTSPPSTNGMDSMVRSVLS